MSTLYSIQHCSLSHISYVKDGKQYLDPIYLVDELITLTSLGQASRKTAEEVLKKYGISPNILQEICHISTIYRYAMEGISSTVGPTIHSWRI